MRLMRRLVPLLLAAVVLATPAFAAEPAALTHRAWLLDGIPEAATLDRLRAAGLDGFVLPIGRLALGTGGVTFEMAPVGDVSALRGWPVTGLLWVDGSGEVPDVDEIVTETAPVRRLLPAEGGLALAATAYSESFIALAAALADRLGDRIEVVLPAAALAEHLPPAGWDELVPVAVALGTPDALGFPLTTPHDDVAALATVGERMTPYRVAVVVQPISAPPAPPGASIASLARAGAADYEPGEGVDEFVLRRPLAWGDTTLPAGSRVAVRAVQTAGYDHALGEVLRPADGPLLGWDTVGLPAPEPTLGMSLEGFLDYFAGGQPRPDPEVVVRWQSSTQLEVVLANEAPHASAVGVNGNWVEVVFGDVPVRDIELGDFAGAEFGVVRNGRWSPAATGRATALRLHMTFVPAEGTLSGAMITFVARPRSLQLRWQLRLGDGSSIEGESPPPVS